MVAGVPVIVVSVPLTLATKGVGTKVWVIVAPIVVVMSSVLVDVVASPAP